MLTLTGVGFTHLSDVRQSKVSKLNRIDNLALSEHLESIFDFYDKINLEKAVTIIRKDIEKLVSKQ